MILTPREMDLFRHVMELGTVTAAAEAAHVRQPAVSKTLQQAEERLGFRLFQRQRKRLVPTTEAQAMYPEVVGALAAIDLVQRLGRDLREGRTGLLTLATTPTLAHGMVPAAIRRFREAHPGVSVSLRAGTATEVIRLVVDHRVDLGLVMGPVGDSRVLVRDLRRAELGCLLPPGHPLAAREALTAVDLAGEALISVAPHQPGRMLLQRAFEEAGVPLSVAVEASRSSIACALAQAGVGIAVLDGFALMGAQRQGMQTRPFHPAVPMQARLLQFRRRAPSQLAQSFMPMLAE
ncbi:LysR family transcriptional regulator [Roseomonas sp. SSH11]|uniref:LysR family transcriptional regulator n=1 Tax=Pararoseomonas baculiformis TaxID=2820812 RepID=A0ABS4ADL1_9PROT|nr:LysR substrate-binding domain-containing protein [Pararoseomonas baculiformis]MBP0445094.1 LysR family transcriptional regulator [Pararoseomonas baculiformis]